MTDLNDTDLLALDYDSKLTWTNERRKLSDLRPWPRNPRQIKREQAERLVESLEQFDQVETIAVGPSGEIYNGHQRLNVWREKYGPDLEVDVRVASRPLTEKEREKLTVFLHKGAAGSWSWDLLANEFEFDELIEWGFDEKELLGLDFGGDEPAEDPGADIDHAEELREKWGVQSGQLWELGEHRLVCGDCTDRAMVERVMQGEKAEAVVTDPPWNVEWKYNEYEDSKTAEEYKLFMDGWQECIKDHLEGTYLFIAQSMRNYKYFAYWFPQAERMFAECQNFTQHTPEDMQYAFNPILVWKIGDPKTEPRAGKRDWYLAETSNTRMTSDKALAKLNTATRWLPTIEYIVENWTHPGGVVYDPFLGSGTTLIACERLSRRCRAIEISAAYVAVAIQRWVDMTGGEPRLVENG